MRSDALRTRDRDEQAMTHEPPTSGQALADYLARHVEMNPSATEFLVRLSESRTLLTAPHTKATLRDGVYKARDNNVGVIAMEAGRLSNSAVLLPTTPGDTDGNWQDGSRFRALLTQVIGDRVLIDVHGMSDKHGVDLVIGTAGGTSPAWLIEAAHAAALRAGFTVEVRHTGPLSAGTVTLTALANRSYNGGVQVEIARRLRNPKTDPLSFSQVIDVIAEVASAANSHR